VYYWRGRWSPAETKKGKQEMKNQLQKDLEELMQIRDEMLHRLKVKTAILRVIEQQIEDTKKRLEGVK
jgi:hypothetical protein